MTAPNRQRLSPVAALCLRVVNGWLRVVSKGKGGELRNGVPYTRLKAEEVRAQLEREEGVEVSNKTIQRALTQLVDTGHLTRRQLYKHRYNRTYWYAPSKPEQQAQAHRPQVVAATYANGRGASKQSPLPRQPVLTEGTSVSLLSLSAQITKSTLSAPDSQTAKQPETEIAPSGVPEGHQEVVSRAWGHRGNQKPKPTPAPHSNRLQQAQQALHTAIQRATARGFGQAPTNSTPVAPVEVRYKAQSAQSAGFLR